MREDGLCKSLCKEGEGRGGAIEVCLSCGRNWVTEGWVGYFSAKCKSGQQRVLWINKWVELKVQNTERNFWSVPFWRIRCASRLREFLTDVASPSIAGNQGFSCYSFKCIQNNWTTSCDVDEDGLYKNGIMSVSDGSRGSSVPLQCATVCNSTGVGVQVRGKNKLRRRRRRSPCLTFVIAMVMIMMMLIMTWNDHTFFGKHLC